MSNNADVMKRWFQEVWNLGRIETIYELLAPDALIHGLGEQGQAVRGPEAFMRFFATMRSAFPDVHVQVEKIIEEGDWVAARFSVTMTYSGNALGFPGNGRKAKVDGMAMGRIAAGKIAEGWNIWDQRALLTQLGAGESTRFLR